MMPEQVSTSIRPMIGISPAYFVSRYGDRFTADQMADGLDVLARMGFTGFQPEIVHREHLDAWRSGGAAQVARRARDAGLATSQLVAHCMMAHFSTPQGLDDPLALEDMLRVIDIVEHFSRCPVVTIPLGPFKGTGPTGHTTSRIDVAQFIDRIGHMEELVAESGRRLALEILPGALIGSIDGFLALCGELDSGTLGLNLDTGHAWVAGEEIYRLPERLGDRLLGTHLCDNDGHENLSLCPGEGTIDWPRLFDGFQAAGYAGPFDIEIICRPKNCSTRYRKGLKYITSLVRKIAQKRPRRIAHALAADHRQIEATPHSLAATVAPKTIPSDRSITHHLLKDGATGKSRRPRRFAC